MYLQPRSKRQCRPNFSQASASMLYVRHHALDQSPELGRVIPNRNVCKFVNHNVFDKGRFQHRDAPVEAERAIVRTTAPTLTLVPDEYLGLEAMAHPRPPAINVCRQYLGGTRAIPRNKGLLDQGDPFFSGGNVGHLYSKVLVIKHNLWHGEIGLLLDQRHIATQVRQCFPAGKLPWHGN